MNCKTIMTMKNEKYKSEKALILSLCFFSTFTLAQERVTTQININTGYTDNVLRSQNSKSDSFFTTVSPKINVNPSFFERKMFFDLSFSKRFYTRSSDYEYLDTSIKLASKIIDHSKHKVSINFSNNNSHNNIGTGISQYLERAIEPVTFRTNNYTIDYSYSRKSSTVGLIAGIDSTLKKYTNQRERFSRLDNNKNTIRLGAYFPLGSESEIRTVVSYRNTNYRSIESTYRDSKSYNFNIFTNLKLINEFSVSGNIGYKSKKFDNTSTGFDGLTADIEIRKPISNFLDFNSSYSRAIIESAFANSYRLSENTSIGLRWKSSDYQINLSYSLRQDELRGQSLNSQDINTYSISFKKNLSERLNFGTSYVVKNANGFTMLNTYNLNEIYISMEYRL